MFHGPLGEILATGDVVQRGGSLDNGDAVPALSQFEGKAKTNRPSADHQYIVGLFKVDHRGHASPGLCRH